MNICMDSGRSKTWHNSDCVSFWRSKDDIFKRKNVSCISCLKCLFFRQGFRKNHKIWDISHNLLPPPLKWHFFAFRFLSPFFFFREMTLVVEGSDFYAWSSLKTLHFNLFILCWIYSSGDGKMCNLFWSLNILSLNFLSKIVPKQLLAIVLDEVAIRKCVEPTAEEKTKITLYHLQMHPCNNSEI